MNTSAFVDRLVLKVVGAIVNAAWADKAVVRKLFEYVRGPAGCAGDRKEWREQVGRNAERVIDCG